MIKFTDGKKEYIWNDNNEIIGMDEMDSDVLKMFVDINCSNNHISPLSVLKSEGYKILEQDIEHEDFIY